MILLARVPPGWFTWAWRLVRLSGSFVPAGSLCCNCLGNPKHHVMFFGNQDNLPLTYSILKLNKWCDSYNSSYYTSILMLFPGIELFVLKLVFSKVQIDIVYWLTTRVAGIRFIFRIWVKKRSAGFWRSPFGFIISMSHRAPDNEMKGPAKKGRLGGNRSLFLRLWNMKRMPVILGGHLSNILDNITKCTKEIRLESLFTRKNRNIQWLLELQAARKENHILLVRYY